MKAHNEILVLLGGGSLYYITKRAMVKKDYKELDEAIKSKVTPYLYNGGQGKMVPIAQLTMLRNRDRPKSKQVGFFVILNLYQIVFCFQFPEIKELGEAAFNYVFEGSELLERMTKDITPEECWYFTG